MKPSAPVSHAPPPVSTTRPTTLPLEPIDGLSARVGEGADQGPSEAQHQGVRVLPRLTSGPGVDPHELWAREAAASKRRALEELLASHIRAWGLPTPEREHRFDPVRRWRLDFAWPAFMVAAEVEGLTREGGRHQRMAGFEKDAEKYTAAQLAGWTLLRFTSRMVRSAQAIRVIEIALQRAARP